MGNSMRIGCFQAPAGQSPTSVAAGVLEDSAMKLLTQALEKKLIANYQITQAAAPEAEPDHWPVVKLFTPWAGATWLLTEFNPVDEVFFGLCDLGLGTPELGWVALADLKSIRGPGGLRIERDIYFKATAPISVYGQAAHRAGYIVEP